MNQIFPNEIISMIFDLLDIKSIVSYHIAFNLTISPLLLEKYYNVNTLIETQLAHYEKTAYKSCGVCKRIFANILHITSGKKMCSLCLMIVCSDCCTSCDFFDRVHNTPCGNYMCKTCISRGKAKTLKHRRVNGDRFYMCRSCPCDNYYSSDESDNE